MDALPLEVLVKILDDVEEDWTALLACREVSKQLKDAVGMKLQSMAKAAIKTTTALRRGLWERRIRKYPGFTTNVLCIHYKPQNEPLVATDSKLRLYQQYHCDDNHLHAVWVIRNAFVRNIVYFPEKLRNNSLVLEN